MRENRRDRNERGKGSLEERRQEETERSSKGRVMRREKGMGDGRGEKGREEKEEGEKKEGERGRKHG